MQYPEYRPRRLRMNENFRRLIAETRLGVDDLIMPLFVRHGEGVKSEISSMPGNYHFSVDALVEEVGSVAGLRIPAVILFGIPEKKDSLGSEACSDDGIVQQAIRAVKKAGHNVLVIADVCLCEYTDHGHCGVVVDGRIDNDRTLELLAKTSLSLARAGADMVAPSDMMDGRVQAIRDMLDDNGFPDTPIMSYAAKYASAFYGPFREAAQCAPQFGDRRSYQMDPANVQEALREVQMDLAEGADIVMVKPALACLDVIHRVKETFQCPVAAYSVSGEFAMVKAAAAKGWLNERDIVMEVLTAIKRSGADIIITYWAKDAARWMSH